MKKNKSNAVLIRLVSHEDVYLFKKCISNKFTQLNSFLNFEHIRMTEDNLKNVKKELELKLQLKDKENSIYIEKIDYLEELVMELEAALKNKSDSNSDALSRFEIKELVRKNRGLKDRISFLRLENVKLKQELEKKEKSQSISSSVIKFPKFEYYKTENENDDLNELGDNQSLTSSVLFQKLTDFLKGCVDDREILGSALFDINGKLLFALIPEKILSNVIREFEVRRKNKLPITEKMFLELRDHQKICSEYFKIQGLEFNLVLIFSQRVNFGIGNMLLRDIEKKLMNLF